MPETSQPTFGQKTSTETAARYKLLMLDLSTRLDDIVAPGADALAVLALLLGSRLAEGARTWETLSSSTKSVVGSVCEAAHGYYRARVVEEGQKSS